MKIVYGVWVLFLLGAICSSCKGKTQAKVSSNGQHSLFDYKVKTIDGDSVSLSVFKGKKILVVNTASKCGLTGQYKELEALYRKYKDDNFVILGFPANNFLGQEPGSDDEIAEFCEKNYGVTFPMMSKISVKGKKMAPVYQFLTMKELNGSQDISIKWNFQKIAVDEEGRVAQSFSPKTSPMDNEIVEWITQK